MTTAYPSVSIGSLSTLKKIQQVAQSAMNLSSSFLGSRFTCRFAQEARVLSTPKQPVTMAKKKGVRCIVTLECTEARAEGATPSRYTTEKVRAAAAASPTCTERFCSAVV